MKITMLSALLTICCLFSNESRSEPCYEEAQIEESTQTILTLLKKYPEKATVTKEQIESLEQLLISSKDEYEKCNQRFEGKNW